MADRTYKVFNRTRNTCLAEAAVRTESLWGRMKGLMGRSRESFAAGQALWILPSEGIHTFGMSFAIDAAYLDSNGVVLRLYHGLRPCRIAAISLKAKSVLELPAGTLAQTHTAIGDVLEFKQT